LEAIREILDFEYLKFWHEIRNLEARFILTWVARYIGILVSSESLAYAL